ncbi:MAG: hypothetical protein E5W25_36860, partial [Mesorhizobium sp.]
MAARAQVLMARAASNVAFAGNHDQSLLMQSASDRERLISQTGASAVIAFAAIDNFDWNKGRT